MGAVLCTKLVPGGCWSMWHVMCHQHCRSPNQAGPGWGTSHNAPHQPSQCGANTASQGSNVPSWQKPTFGFYSCTNRPKGKLLITCHTLNLLPGTFLLLATLRTFTFTTFTVALNTRLSSRNKRYITTQVFT